MQRGARKVKNKLGLLAAAHLEPNSLSHTQTHIHTPYNHGLHERETSQLHPWSRRTAMPDLVHRKQGGRAALPSYGPSTKAPLRQLPSRKPTVACRASLWDAEPTPNDTSRGCTKSHPISAEAHMAVSHNWACVPCWANAHTHNVDATGADSDSPPMPALTDPQSCRPRICMQTAHKTGTVFRTVQKQETRAHPGQRWVVHARPPTPATTPQRTTFQPSKLALLVAPTPNSRELLPPRGVASSPHARSPHACSKCLLVLPCLRGPFPALHLLCRGGECGACEACESSELGWSVGPRGCSEQWRCCAEWLPRDTCETNRGGDGQETRRPPM